MLKWESKTEVQKTRIIFCLVMITFLAEVLIRFYFSDFTKSVHTYRDELRYLQIAKSIWANGSLSVYGTDNDYQKILYSLILFPTFFIKNSITRVRIISLINSVLIGSTVFPSYLISKKLSGNNHKIILLSLLLVSVLPDMCFSLTFMSENLFLPMGMWEVYFLIALLSETDHKKQVFLSIFNGIFSYAIYLTKEVSLYFVISFVIVSILLSIRNRSISGLLRSCVGYVLSFGACFLLAKLTIFNSMGNSYDQTSLSQIGTHYRLEYMFYSIGVHVLFLLLVYMFFTLVYPGISFKALSDIQKISYLFIALCVLINIFTIAFSISVREDLGRIIPRQHMRYYAPLIMPVFIIFLCALEGNKEEKPKRNYLLIILTAVFATMFLCKANTRIPYTIADFTNLRIYNFAFDFHFQDITEGEGAVIFNNGIVLFKIFVLAYLALGCFLLISKNKKVCLTFFIISILLFELSNSALAIRQIKSNYSVSDEQIKYAEKLNEYLDGVNGNILVVVDYLLVENLLIDTYVTSEYCVINEGQLQQANSDEGYIDLNETKFQTIYKNHNTVYSEYNDFDYIISYHELPFEYGRVEEIEDVEWDKIHVYHNLYPTQLWLKYN